MSTLGPLNLEFHPNLPVLDVHLVHNLLNKRIVLHVFNSRSQSNDSVHFHDLLIIWDPCDKAQECDSEAILLYELTNLLIRGIDIFKCMSNVHVDSCKWPVWSLWHPQFFSHVRNVLLCEYHSHLS